MDDNDFIGLTYKELLLVIPKMPDDRIRELIAFLQLEMCIRSKKKVENKDD